MGKKVKGRASMCASSDLHFRVHTATDIGHAPGRAGSDLSVGQRRKDGLFVLIEGLQGGVLAGTPELKSATHRSGCFTTWYSYTACWLGYTASTSFRHVQGHVSIYN